MKYNYRPEIDGLRAIAVSAVIIYHAQIDVLNYRLFSGGYIGVDIFFVISGYLITLILLKELKTKKKISFLYFYERRIRRILPALLFMMMVCIPFAWIYLLPSSLVDFSKSLLYSIGFTSNIYFHYSGQEYGAQGGLFLPLLHTWSLSVEEQFYILFPAIIFIAFNYFKEVYIYIFILAIIISLMFASRTVETNSSIVFYFLQFRIWELLSGSMLAYFEIKNNHRSLNKKMNLIMPSIGIILILYSLLFYSNNTLHPSYITLVPVVGVCFVIWFSSKNEITTKLLSSKLFVGIGLISYSLYLWHYPIFAFYRYAFASGSIFFQIILVFILFICSLLSYFFIERKFRDKNFSFKKIFNILFSIILILITVNVIIIYKNGYPKRAVIDGINIDREFYLDEISNWEKTFYEYNVKNSTKNLRKNILIIGDSHADNFAMVFQTNNDLFNEYEFNILGRANLLIKYFEDEMIRPSDRLLIDDAEYVLFSYNYDYEELKIVKKAIKLINDRTNKKIILTTNNPIYSLYGSRFTDLDFFLIKNNRKPNNLELVELEKKYYNFLKNNETYFYFNDELKKISRKFNLLLLDKSNYQCNEKNKRCLVLTNKDEKINWDSDHHTLRGARYLGEMIFKNKWFKLD